MSGSIDNEYKRYSFPTSAVFILLHHPLSHQHHYSSTCQTSLYQKPTTIMQITIGLTTLLSVVSAAAVTKRYSATLVERQSGVCGGLATALCCQTDVLGAANLNCANGQSPSDI
jgi:hypothetical protein